MKNKIKSIWLLSAINIVWAIFIFVLCTMPGDKLPNLSFPYIDKLVHFTFFFMQSCMLTILLHYLLSYKMSSIVIISTVWAFVYGGLIEILQGQYFNRSAEFLDLVCDVSGGLVGAIIVYKILDIFFIKNNSKIQA